VALVLALALALVVGVAPAAFAAPNASQATGKPAAQPDTRPAAAQEPPSNAIPLLLAGIVFLALLTPFPLRRRSGYGSGYGDY